MGGKQPEGPATAVSFRQLVERRGDVADWVLLALPAIAIVGVFVLPMAQRQALAFHAGEPTLVSAYTSHFVHYSLGHLLTNLGGYLLLAPLAYLLSAGAGRRRQFHVVFGALLLGFPFVLSLVNLLLVQPATAIGFSGIVLGFFGYLPIALYQYVGRHAEGRAPTRYLPMAFFVGVGSIALVLFWATFVSLGIVFTVLTVLAGYLSRFVDRGFITGVGRLKESGFGEVAMAATALLLMYPVVAFPSSAVLGSRVVNLVLHFVGYALSFISTFVTIVVTRWSDTLRSFSPKGPGARE